jgi:ferredoxin
LNRREFLKGSAAGIAAAATAASTLGPAGCKGTPAGPLAPHRHIDPSTCVGCGECVTVCPMGAIVSSGGETWIEADECAECGTCQRTRVCPVSAIRPGALVWPRTLREVFSNPLSSHKATGVPGRGTEGIKTNDVTNRYQRGFVGVFIELGRPALGTRFRDVERVVKVFRARGYALLPENPVSSLIVDPATGALNPEVLGEKAVSVLLEFLLPEEAAADLEDMLDEASREVETVFSVSVALRADPDGASPFRRLFGPEASLLPAGKVNVGLAAGIAGPQEG